MKQFYYKLDSRNQFSKWVMEVQNSEEYRNSKSVVFKVMTTDLPEASTRDLHRRMNKYFPKAKIISMSMTNFINKQITDDFDLEDWTQKIDSGYNEDFVIFGCCYFDSTDVTLIEVDGNHIDNLSTMISEVNKKLKKIPDLKGVEILCSSGTEYIGTFLELATVGLENVPFFGAIAGFSLPRGENLETLNLFRGLGGEGVTQYVAGKEYHNDGIVMLAYSGKDLHINTEYSFGWKPLGKEMIITETLGISTISKIDNVPAIDIYKKYLGIEANDFLLFNVFDFPFVVNRGGLDASRVAEMFDEDGKLHMNGEIRHGEKIRLSYGNPAEILNETWECSERMRKFCPQGITSYICGARTVFLDEDAEREFNDFRRIDPQMICCFGASELYKFRGMGGQVATCFLSIGFREGEGCLCEEIEQSQTEVVHMKMAVPLANRLAAFLKATADDLVESNKKFKEAALMAEEASRAKSNFLSNMSHEIRTPINAILGMNEMILREAVAPNIIEYAENIQMAGNTLLGLVNDILDFSKIEAGKMEIIPVEYSLSSLLNDLVHMIQSRAAKKDLTFNINASPDLPSELFGDEIRLKQIVTNILSNAVKYTEKGGITLTVNGRNLPDNKIKLFFSIKDTGIGIKKEDIKKLFSAFERIDEKRNRTVEGTGLGMNITQRLLNMMHSSLQVQSVYGEGSEFSFELEQKVVNPHPIGNFEENFKHAFSQHKKYREKFTAPDAKILVVDDTVMNLTVVKGLLKQTKIQIDTADSGYEALSMVTKKRYDIIFLDHRMPGIDGIETLQRMKDLQNNLNHDVPTISLTANAISGARKQYIDAGFQDYLTKPIDSEKFESMIMEYLPPEKVHLHSADDENFPEEAEKKSLPEWLYLVEDLDVIEGVRHCGGVEAYLDAITVFAQSIISGANEIANFYKKSDWKNYTTKVHALKSSAKVIGANELSNRALRLEDAGNSGYINEIYDSTDELLKLYISFADKLAPLIKNDSDDEDKPLISDEELAEGYEALKEVSTTFDYDTLMFLIQSMDGYKMPDAEKEKFAEIKSAASKPDWETLQKLLE